MFLKGAAQGCGYVSCIMVDIDHFKSINDRFGHLLGDQVIHRVALTLREATPAGDLVCRYGGEEFCMLVTGVKADQAQQFADQIRKLIENSCAQAVLPGQAARITASFGVVSFDSGAATLAELIKQADQALYLAKSSGRNRVCRYDELSSPQPSALAAA